MTLHLKGLIDMILLNESYDFELILVYDLSETERVEIFSNRAYDVRILLNGHVISDIQAFPNEIFYEFLPNLEAWYDDDHGTWRVSVTYQSYDEERSNNDKDYLKEYMTCNGLGENASRSLTNLLNKIDELNGLKACEEWRQIQINSNYLNGLLKESGQESEGEWS